MFSCSSVHELAELISKCIIVQWHAFLKFEVKSSTNAFRNERSMFIQSSRPHEMDVTVTIVAHDKTLDPEEVTLKQAMLQRMGTSLELTSS
jgi:hypothetical protein